MIKKINDIRNALNNGTYYCALALALTLPDICGQVENHLKSGDRNSYIKWVNDYIEEKDYKSPLAGFEAQEFTGEMCYSLRCKVLHNGNTDVKNEKLNVFVDDFILTFPSDKNYYNGFVYIEKANGKTITHIGIDYVCERICDAAEKFYNNWPCKEDFEKYSF